MNIEPSYATFEQSKILKQKGFISRTTSYYFSDGEFRTFEIRSTYGYYGEEYNVDLDEFYYNWNDNYVQKKNGDTCFGCKNNPNYFETYSAPEHWQIVEWASLVHNIDIEARPVRFAGDEKTSYYQANINGCVANMNKYSTRKEALSASIDEFLKMI